MFAGKLTERLVMSSSWFLIVDLWQLRAEHRWAVETPI